MPQENRPGQRDEGPSQSDIARAESVSSNETASTGKKASGRTWVIVGAIMGILTAGLMVGGLVATLPRRSASDKLNQLVNAEVIGVVDGQTITVKIKGKDSTVRYIGVDAPPLGDPKAGQTVATNRRWVSGKQVVLARDAEDKDSQGRLLRYVYVDNTMVNGALILSGLAKMADLGKNTRYQAEFKQLEETAKGQQLGVWAAPQGRKLPSVPGAHDGLEGATAPA